MNSSRRKARSGMTLIEILIVLILISLLAGTVIFNVTKTLEGNTEAITKLFVNETVKVPLVTYRIHMGNYPSTEEGMQALITPPANRSERWKGPYIENKTVPLDPWGNPYQYRYPGTKNADKYDLWSWGPDGRESADDIGNW
ncbi:MAG TPA: type II secretion system major pseudopilin GspG [Opitutaceae bacterium]